MRYIAASTGDVYGVTYLAGDEVDTTTWIRRQLLDALSAGTIAPAVVTAAALGDTLGTQGAATITLASGQVVLVIDAAVSTLSDVDLSGLKSGMTLTYDSSAQLWRASPASSAGDLSDLSDVATTDVVDGQTLVWSADNQSWLAGDARPGPGVAVSSWMDWTPVLSATTTNPVMGNTIVSGEWMRVGMLATVRGSFRPGSTWTAGSGTYQVSLPVPPVVGDDHDVNLDVIIGSAQLSGNGATSVLGMLVAQAGGLVFQMWAPTSATSPAIAPITSAAGPAGTGFSSGGVIRFEARYHVAAGF